MSGTVLLADWKVLISLSRGRCALCRKELVAEATDADSAAIIGVAAHIRGENPGSARHDPQQPAPERNKYLNLIYLCNDCHTTIDKQENSYPVDLLLIKKVEHEKWALGKLSDSMLTVQFPELDVIAKAIRGKPHNPTLDFAVLAPRDKMTKNNLSNQILEELKIGYGKAEHVGDYMERMADLDPDFPEQLKAGFVEKYNFLLAKGYAGDTLFYALHEFAYGGSSDFLMQAAGLSILTYLFQKCEVFEH